MTGVAGLAVVAAVLAVATGFGLWRRRRDGRVRATAGQSAVARPDLLELVTSLGFVPGTPATLLQFSSAFCAPCRATRVTCGRVAADHAGVRHVEVDAESHLDAVRALRVWRTPTVFVLASDGQVVARVTGQPTRDQLVEATTPLLAEAVRS